MKKNPKKSRLILLGSLALVTTTLVVGPAALITKNELKKDASFNWDLTPPEQETPQLSEFQDTYDYRKWTWVKTSQDILIKKPTLHGLQLSGNFILSSQRQDQLNLINDVLQNHSHRFHLTNELLANGLWYLMMVDKNGKRIRRFTLYIHPHGDTMAQRFASDDQKVALYHAMVDKWDERKSRETIYTPGVLKPNQAQTYRAYYDGMATSYYKTIKLGQTPPQNQTEPATFNSNNSADLAKITATYDLGTGQSQKPKKYQPLLDKAEALRKLATKLQSNHTILANLLEQIPNQFSSVDKLEQWQWNKLSLVEHYKKLHGFVRAMISYEMLQKKLTAWNLALANYRQKMPQSDINQYPVADQAILTAPYDQAASIDQYQAIAANPLLKRLLNHDWSNALASFAQLIDKTYREQLEKMSIKFDGDQKMQTFISYMKGIDKRLADLENTKSEMRDDVFRELFVNIINDIQIGAKTDKLIMNEKAYHEQVDAISYFKGINQEYSTLMTLYKRLAMINDSKSTDQQPTWLALEVGQYWKQVGASEQVLESVAKRYEILLAHLKVITNSWKKEVQVLPYDSYDQDAKAQFLRDHPNVDPHKVFADPTVNADRLDFDKSLLDMYNITAKNWASLTKHIEAVMSFNDDEVTKEVIGKVMKVMEANFPKFSFGQTNETKKLFNNLWYMSRLISGDKNNQSPLLQKIYDQIYFSKIAHSQQGYALHYRKKVSDHITIHRNKIISPHLTGYVKPTRLGEKYNPQNSFVAFTVQAHHGYKFRVLQDDGTYAYKDQVQIIKIVDGIGPKIPTHKLMTATDFYHLNFENIYRTYLNVDDKNILVDPQQIKVQSEHYMATKNFDNIKLFGKLIKVTNNHGDDNIYAHKITISGKIIANNQTQINSSHSFLLRPGYYQKHKYNKGQFWGYDALPKKVSDTFTNWATKFDFENSRYYKFIKNIYEKADKSEFTNKNSPMEFYPELVASLAYFPKYFSSIINKGDTFEFDYGNDPGALFDFVKNSEMTLHFMYDKGPLFGKTTDHEIFTNVATRIREKAIKKFEEERARNRNQGGIIGFFEDIGDSFEKMGEIIGEFFEDIFLKKVLPITHDVIMDIADPGNAVTREIAKATDIPVETLRRYFTIIPGWEGDIIPFILPNDIMSLGIDALAMPLDLIGGKAAKIITKSFKKSMRIIDRTWSIAKKVAKVKDIADDVNWKIVSDQIDTISKVTKNRARFNHDLFDQGFFKRKNLVDIGTSDIDKKLKKAIDIDVKWGDEKPDLKKMIETPNRDLSSQFAIGGKEQPSWILQPEHIVPSSQLQTNSKLKLGLLGGFDGKRISAEDLAWADARAAKISKYFLSLEPEELSFFPGGRDDLEEFLLVMHDEMRNYFHGFDEYRFVKDIPGFQETLLLRDVENLKDLHALLNLRLDFIDHVRWNWDVVASRNTTFSYAIEKFWIDLNDTITGIEKILGSDLARNMRERYTMFYWRVFRVEQYNPRHLRITRREIEDHFLFLSEYQERRNTGIDTMEELQEQVLNRIAQETGSNRLEYYFNTNRKISQVMQNYWAKRKIDDLYVDFALDNRTRGYDDVYRSIYNRYDLGINFDIYIS